MKNFLSNILTVLQVLFFGIIYYIGGVLSSFLVERKSYDFKTWMNTTNLIARDMRRIIAVVIAALLLTFCGIVNTLIISLTSIVVINITYYIVKRYSHGRTEE